MNPHWLIQHSSLWNKRFSKCVCLGLCFFPLIRKGWLQAFIPFHLCKGAIETQQLSVLDISKQAEKNIIRREPISCTSWIVLALVIKVWVKDEMKNVSIAASSKSCFSGALLPPVLSALLNEWWVLYVTCLLNGAVYWAWTFWWPHLLKWLCRGFMDCALVPFNFPLEENTGSSRSDKDWAERDEPAPNPWNFCSQK